jgi:hypothetical protein
MFCRNVLVQPGPLSVPRANRSLDEPSYRIIDFGRGISLGVNIFSLQDLRREAESEQRDALAERLTSSKRKRSPSDVSDRSSASSKRRRPSATANTRLEGDFEKLHHILQYLYLTVENALREPLVPAPRSSTEAQVHAVMQFLKRFQDSKSSGNEWLSSDQVAKVVDVFWQDNFVAELYVLLNEARCRMDPKFFCDSARL